MRRTAYTVSAFVLCLFAWLNDGHAQYNTQQWPRITLRFSETGTLKDLFDSGLKPYRFPSLEKSLLEAKHARVTVLQRNGQTLPEFPAEQITINPLQGGLLSSLEMTRHKTTLEEARSLMLPYLNKGGRNVQELDEYLAAVKTDYLDHAEMGRGVEYFRVRWSDNGGPRYVVAFRKAFDPTRPLIMIISIDWSQVRTPLEGRSFYKEPVPPPPGYENESMQAPEKFGPDSQVDILVSQGKPITGDRLPAEEVSSKAATPPLPVGAADPASLTPAPKVAETSGPMVERKSPVWPWVVGILILVVIVMIALKRRV